MGLKRGDEKEGGSRYANGKRRIGRTGRGGLRESMKWRERGGGGGEVERGAIIYSGFGRSEGSSEGLTNKPPQVYKHPRST